MPVVQIGNKKVIETGSVILGQEQTATIDVILPGGRYGIDLVFIDTDPDSVAGRADSRPIPGVDKAIITFTNVGNALGGGLNAPMAFAISNGRNIYIDVRAEKTANLSKHVIYTITSD